MGIRHLMTGAVLAAAFAVPGHAQDAPATTKSEAPAGSPVTSPAGGPAEGKGRTYTGGRRSADEASPAIDAGTTPPGPAEKSINEKGVAASKPSKPK